LRSQNDVNWTHLCAAWSVAVSTSRSRRRRRRCCKMQAVHAAVCTDAAEQDEEWPDWVVDSIRTNARLTGLVWLMSEDELLEAASTMYQVDVDPGQVIITQGTIGSQFYIIDSGSFEVFVANELYPDPGSKVGDLGPGDSFGELALLYSIPRSATVVATSSASVWVMEREAFQAAVTKGAQQPVSPKFLAFLEDMELFKGVPRQTLEVLGRSLIPKWFKNGDEIIAEGEFQECFYILRSGEMQAVARGEAGEEEVGRWSEPGAIIGSDVLLGELRRQSDRAIRSCSDVTVAFWMSKLTFDNVAGEYKETILRNLEGSEQRIQQEQQEGCVCM